MELTTFLELWNAPKDIWNLIGAAFVLVPGVWAYFLLDRHFQRLVERLRERGKTELAAEKERAWKGLLRPVTLIINVVILPLYGFFIMGPAFRDAFGG